TCSFRPVTAHPDLSPLSLHDALPIYRCRPPRSVTMRALRRPPLAWTRHPAARRGAPAPKRTAMSTQDNWYIERFEPTGSAIGYRVEAKLDEVQSPFQKIEIYKTTDWGNLMLIDGAVMLTSRDNFLYHEMISHPALFTHGAPKRVVIIGGGDCGTLREVLKHPGVESATQCDIDEQVTRMAEKHFPELCD